MKIGILCATEGELLPLVQAMEAAQKTTYLMRDFYEGTLDGVPVTAVIGGIGKVNAAITAQSLILCYGAELLLFTGIAGGLDDRLAIGDVVIGDQVAHHDLDMTMMNNDQFPGLPTDWFVPDPRLLALCQGLGTNIHLGRIVSGEVFVTGAQREDLIQRFHPLCVDMESAAVCQVCWFHKTPVLIIRALSDRADEDAVEVYFSNKEGSCRSASEVVRELVRRLAADPTF